jgi:NDP-sugar pyrophosphorylase family protein
MIGVILAGGYGIRLLPITLRTPKCLLPIAGKPNIYYLIRLLKGAGIKQIFISMNINQLKIREYLGSGERFGVKLKYIIEKTRGEEDKLGTVGALQNLVEKIGVPKECILVGGDNFVFGLDLSRMREYAGDGVARIVLYYLSDKSKVSQVGVVELDKQSGRILRIQEKPRAEDAISRVACTLFYHLRARFFEDCLKEYIRMKRLKGERADVIGKLWEQFVASIPVYGYLFKGIWGDIGTPKSYLEINRAAMGLIKGRISRGASLAKEGKLKGEVQIARGARIEKGVEIRGPVMIERNCWVRKGVKVGPYVHLMHGSEIGEGCNISSSIIFEGVRIGRDSSLKGCIVDGKAIIGSEVEIQPFSILGYGCKIGNGSKVLRSSKIWPKLSIGSDSLIRGEITCELLGEMAELRRSCYWR